jgi:hypothetical protein
MILIVHASTIWGEAHKHVDEVHAVHGADQRWRQPMLSTTASVLAWVDATLGLRSMVAVRLGAETIIRLIVRAAR